MTDLLDPKPLLARAEALLDHARRAGAEAADVVALRDMSLSVQLREGKVESSERSEGEDLGLRVFLGGRSAAVSSNDPREDLKGLAERAVAIARVTPEDRFAGLAGAGEIATSWPNLDLLDPDLAEVATLEAWARAAEDAALSVAGVTRSGGASAATGLGGMALVTSNGFSGVSLGSSFYVAMTAIAGEGVGMERDYDYSAARHRADMGEAAAIGREAGLRAVRRLNPRKVDTRKAPVIFDARTAASLAGHLASAVNGQSVARKTTFLREKMGERLFKPGVTILDDPLRPRGLASRPFDGEGVATRRLALVEDGYLRSWTLDCASARELGLATTGSASRGVGSAPSPSTSNLHLAAGTASPQDLIGAVADGLYVTDLIGQGVNGVTGDYSRGCSGYWIENGALAYPVAEITIAGHLLEMFANLTPANDLAFTRSVNAPTVLVEGLTIAGR